jgi:hypothetical protein
MGVDRFETLTVLDTPVTVLAGGGEGLHKRQSGMPAH